jgi:amino acid transporter
VRVSRHDHPGAASGICFADHRAAHRHISPPNFAVVKRQRGRIPPDVISIVNRQFGLVHATALNMNNMIGIGPFITIPLLMTALGGPQAMLGWIVALVIVLCDGMVWSELGAAMPASGGSFGYLREAYGRSTFGRLMAFLFVWQFILSGPLEIASGYIGFANYLSYIWSGLSGSELIAVCAAVGVVNVLLLYRRITSIARITVTLWIGTLITTIGVIVTGLFHFDPRVAFDFPPNAFSFARISVRSRRSVARCHLRLSRLLRHLLHRR